MDNAINLNEAAQISGKSKHTIRRWVREGILEDQRAQGDKFSPLLVDEANLRSYLGTLPEKSSGPKTVNIGSAKGSILDYAQPTRDDPLVHTLRTQCDKWEKLFEGAQRERDQWRQMYEDMKKKADALEQELWKRDHQGIRGLIKGGMKILGR